MKIYKQTHKISGIIRQIIVTFIGLCLGIATVIIAKEYVK